MSDPPPAADISSYKFERIREGRPDPEPDMEMTRENPIIGAHRHPDTRRLVPVYDNPPKPPVKPRRAKPTHGPWFQAVVILEIMVGALCCGVLMAVLIWR